MSFQNKTTNAVSVLPCLTFKILIPSAHQRAIMKLPEAVYNHHCDSPKC